MLKLLTSLLLILIAATAVVAAPPAKQMTQSNEFDVAAATRFADLALACVHKEYPNKIAHSMNSDADIGPPRKLTPAFYGCYDWHSSVHGHWLLARLSRMYPNAPFVPKARAALKQSLTPENIAVEAKYVSEEGRASFERPYGLAWLLTLAQELREWNDPDAQQMAANLKPLEDAVLTRLKTWLPKLSHPIRIGEHNQTAFALGLLLDSAKQRGDSDFVRLLGEKARAFYFNDKNCPLAYEPSGEDFLSPCIAEADVMRRVLAPADFAHWLTAFMPQVPTNGSAAWLVPVISPDRSDPKLAHLDGLNLSRAWMLQGIVSGLPPNDKRVAGLRAAAEAHRKAGLDAVTGEHYEGGHWLGSFATYLVTQRGIAK